MRTACRSRYKSSSVRQVSNKNSCRRFFFAHNLSVMLACFCCTELMWAGCAGLAVSMFIGRVFMGKRYTFQQIVHTLASLFSLPSQRDGTRRRVLTAFSSLLSSSFVLSQRLPWRSSRRASSSRRSHDLEQAPLYQRRRRRRTTRAQQEHLQPRRTLTRCVARTPWASRCSSRRSYAQACTAHSKSAPTTDTDHTGAKASFTPYVPTASTRVHPIRSRGSIIEPKIK